MEDIWNILDAETSIGSGKKKFEIDWSNCTNKEEILSQYSEDEFKKLIPYGVQLEPDKFRYIKFGKWYASIDDPIADLIIYLNDNCYATEYCCCGHKYNYGYNSEYYIKFSDTELNRHLIRRITEKVVVNKDDFEKMMKNFVGLFSKEYIKKYTILNSEAKKHISMFEVIQQTIYFKWRRPEDIAWINKLIINCI